MNTSAISVDAAVIQRMHAALNGLSNTASTDGCEAPWGVIDMTCLDNLKSAFVPLCQKLDELEKQASQLTRVAGLPDELPEKEVTVVVEAFETSRWGAEGPEFMSFSVTRKWLLEMQSKVAYMSQQGMDSINLTRRPKDWGPGNVYEELRLQGSVFVLTAGGELWFEDRPIHADYLIQSRSVSIGDVQMQFEASEHLGTQFISSSVYDGSVAELAAMYWDDERDKALNSLPAGEGPDPESTTPQQLRYARALAAVEALDAGDETIPPAAPVSN